MENAKALKFQHLKIFRVMLVVRCKGKICVGKTTGCFYFKGGKVKLQKSLKLKIAMLSRQEPKSWECERLTVKLLVILICSPRQVRK